MKPAAGTVSRWVASPLGEIRLVATDTALVAAHLPPHAAGDALVGPNPLLDLAEEQLGAYLRGDLRAFTVPLAPEGTPFQQEVWAALRQIPWGEVRSYADIAQVLGRPAATRAVGAANGRNPIAILVPCHRVIGADGSLTGYAGGLAAKEWLLRHEGIRLPEATAQLPLFGA